MKSLPRLATSLLCALVCVGFLMTQSTALAQQKAPPPADLKAAVSAAPWTWKLGNRSVGIVTFKPGSVATYRNRGDRLEWAMTWSISGENDIKLVHQSGKSTILHFNPQRTEYEGADFEGKVLTGKISKL